MDAQILGTISNVFQIVGVLWVLFFGSRTVFEALKAKNVPSPYSSAPISNYHRPRDSTWEWTGIFIIFFSSVAWVAFKANVLHADLLWYEVFIIGLSPSSYYISVETHELKYREDTRQPPQPGMLPRIIGYIFLGPLFSISAYFS